MTMKKAPGKSHREGISLLELAEMFPDEHSAVQWFEAIFWPEGRCCGHCGCLGTKEVPNAKPMPYWCPDCRSYFSVRTGTALKNSRLPLRKWVFAVYLYVTSLKGVSSMKLHRDLNVTQKTAWYMLGRLREAWSSTDLDKLLGPVEVDESYFGGIDRNKHAKKRSGIRGPSGKTAVVGMKDRASKQVRAKVVEKTDAETLQGFVIDHADPDATVYTDDAKAYKGLPFKHESVKHSIGEYVKNQAHSNGIESFWSMLKRAHKGTFHKISPKHLDRYVQEFAGRQNVREFDTIGQMQNVVAGMVGRQLGYRDLIADNGLSNAARR